jgi:hypothetical protein
MFKRKKDKVDILIHNVAGLMDSMNNFITDIKHYIDKRIDEVPKIDTDNLKSDILLNVNKQLDIINNNINKLVYDIDIKLNTFKEDVLNRLISRDSIENILLPLNHNIIQQINCKLQKVNENIIKYIDNQQKVIVDKYINSINNLLEWHKEIGILLYLSGKLNIDDINKLRKTIQQPFLEQKWLEQKAIDAEKIDNIMKSNAGQLRQIYDSLKQEKLKLEREGRDIKYINGQLNILEKMIGGGTSEKV